MYTLFVLSIYLARYSSSTLEVLRKMAYTEVDVDYKLVASIVHHVLMTTQVGIGLTDYNMY